MLSRFKSPNKRRKADLADRAPLRSGFGSIEPSQTHKNPSHAPLQALQPRPGLQPGTFEYAVYYLFEHKLDLKVFIEVPQR